MLVRTDIPEPPFTFETRFDAWDYLRHLLHLMYALFGAPAKLARLGGVSLDFRADMHMWLRAAERLARILLIAEAADLTLPKRRAGANKRYVFPRPDISKPNSEDWRVAFPVLRASTKAGSGAKGYSIPCISAARLAARFEALARVVLDPMRYARRLAHRLRRSRLGKAVCALLRPAETEGAPLMRAANAALPLARLAASTFDTG